MGRQDSAILVVKLSAMGDIVHALPAAHRLKELLPHHRIHWVVASRWAPLLQGVTCVHKVIPLSRGMLPYLKTLRSLRGYQAAIDLQGLLKSAVLTAGSTAPLRTGLAPHHAREPVASLLYNQKVSPTKRHVVEQLIEVVEEAARVLGKAPDTTPNKPVFGLHPTEEEIRWSESCLSTLGISPPFAVILPGTGWRTKTWTPDKFAVLANMISKKLSMPSLVVWGPGEEHLIPEGEGVFVAPPTGLREMISLLSRATVVVGGDTGPLHIAAALGVPVVGLYGPTLPERNGPYSEKAEVVVKPCPHRGEHKRECSEPCVESIPPDEVFKAVERLLSRYQSPTSL